MFKQARARPKQRRDQSALNVCWRRAHHSPPGPGPGSQTLEFNDRSPSRQEPDDRTVPRRRRDDREPLYENCGALQAAGVRAAPPHLDRVGVGRLYGRLDVIGSGVGRIEHHLSSSCGNINHYHYQCEYEWCGRMQWVVLQRPPAPSCRPRPARAPLPPGLDDGPPPPPSCSFHNLPESYVTERAYSVKKCHRARKVSPRADSCDAEMETAAVPSALEVPDTQATSATQDGQERSCKGKPEEEPLDWSLLIPEEEGSYFGHDDYDSDSDNGMSIRSLCSTNASIGVLTADKTQDTKTAPKDVNLSADPSGREAASSTFHDLSQPSTSKSKEFGQPFSFNDQTQPSTSAGNEEVLASKDTNSTTSNDDTDTWTGFEGCEQKFAQQAPTEDTKDLFQSNIMKMIEVDARRSLKDKKDTTMVAKNNKQSSASPKGTKEINPFREVFKLVTIPKEINKSNGTPKDSRHEGSKGNDKIGRASERDDSSEEENKELGD